MGNEICSNVKVSQQKLTLLKQNIVIKSKAAKRVLDICQDQDALGTLIIYEDYNMPNQRFDIQQAGQHIYIKSHKTGKYLTVGSNSQKNSAPIFQQPVTRTVGQKFRLGKINDNEYFIHTFCGKVLGLSGNQTSNGTRVVQYDLTRAQDQKWIIQ